MCEHCNRIEAQKRATFSNPYYAQGVLGSALGGAIGGPRLLCHEQQQQQALGLRQSVEHNRNYEHVSKAKMAEIAANMEKAYMMIPSCGVRDKLEEAAEYLKRMAK